MAIAATESSFDVALWFVEYARSEDDYLQAQKLQRLLWLAQGEYARAYHGRKLMPTIFLAHELGPVEPNVYRAFELGRPEIPDVRLPPEIEDFLIRIWGRFGHHATEHLNTVVRGHSVYREALAKGVGEEIEFLKIAAFFKEDVEKRKVSEIRSPDGRLWKKWSPRSVK
ncbi:MAG: hypothetical protein JKY20_12745 [Alphaproteobacteria bacterium]|nr:hypothetical protein [Alphaproteobacteria bacterium]